MDKSKLYYLVQKGTNNRAQTTSKSVLIVEEAAVGQILSEYSSRYEKITIEEFEKKFEIKVDGDKSGKN